MPRCQACGSETRQVGVFIRPTPRLAYKCPIPACSLYDLRRTIACSEDWRALVLLSRTTPEYLALRESHSEYEGTHAYYRSRYKVAPDSLSMRPKRIGAAAQQLRADAAVLLEWLRICWREGWLPGVPRQRRDAHRIHIRNADAFVERMRAIRRSLGLHLPYGRFAITLGAQRVTPPDPDETAPQDAAAAPPEPPRGPPQPDPLALDDNERPF